MLERAVHGASRWVLDRVDPQWVDYVASNTMTDINRRLNRFIWTYELQAQVVRVTDEAPGVKTFELRPNQLWRGMQPGQHVAVLLPVDGEEAAPLRRHYSATVLPRGRFSITVKRLINGRGSNWMHEHLKPGSLLRLDAAQGSFVHKGQAKVLHLCAGSGITPAHSMVEALLAGPEAQRPDQQVIAQFSRPEDVIFKTALPRWQLAGVKVDTVFGGQAGARLTVQKLQKLCPDLVQRDIYLCGPEGFMAQMMSHLQALGVDLARVHSERFTVPADTACAAEGFSAEGTEVVFKHLGRSITLTAADQNKTLLQAARDHGLDLESGCCQGMCGTCKLTVHEGEVSGNTLGRAVYMCTAYPASRTLVLGG
ncbi:MAG TPA: iron-sulfur cluster-binding domain-containing protein [Candidatus Aquabacterium excrementipullorum]|nr:iron-sulfur cluster-binding domain-containing protein [Candidatus Aquabacterium excrementipullorum]